MAFLRFLLALLVALASAAPITEAASTTLDGRLASLDAKVAKLAVSKANVENQFGPGEKPDVPCCDGGGDIFFDLYCDPYC